MFENEVETTWQKGATSESVYHAGRVGINTDHPDEALVVHGNVRITGHLVQPSDMRAKEGIEEVALLPCSQYIIGTITCGVLCIGGYEGTTTQCTGLTRCALQVHRTVR